MSRSLPPLNALRAFEAAGRHGSFTGAARELSVSHSAISRHVRGLEDRLGAQLFREASRGVELAEAGRSYLAEVTPALDRIAAASEVFTDRAMGMLTVDAEPLFAAKWLIPRLGDFYAKYPDIELRLEGTRGLADVARYEADLAIRFFDKTAPSPDDPMVSNTPMFPFIAPHLMPEPFRQPEELLQFNLLRDRADNTWIPWFRRTGGDAALVPDERWRMRATLAIEAAVAGQGVILISEDLVLGAVEAGQLVRCWDTGYRRGGYHMVFAEGVQRRAAVRSFRDWLLDQSAGLRTRIEG